MGNYFRNPIKLSIIQYYKCTDKTLLDEIYMIIGPIA